MNKEAVQQETTKAVQAAETDTEEESVTADATDAAIATTEALQETLAPATNKDEALDNLQKIIAEKISGIVCWGDSLTVGAGSDVSYPDELRELIQTNILEGTGCEIPVVMMGVGGENSYTIAARACGLPLMVTQDFTIPAECTPVQFTFRTVDGYIAEPTVYGDLGLEYVEINGVRGTLDYLPDVTGESGARLLYYFKRNDPGEAVTVPAGTQILTRAYMEYKDYLPIIFMGENGGFADAQELIRQQMSIVDIGKNTDRYLIIGITSGTAADRQELETAMKEQYGRRYLNAREMLSSDGMSMMEVESTVFDQWMIDEGRIPGRLLSDSVHLNEAGYRALGIMVYDRLMELGYFDEVIEAAEIYRQYQ
jgi:hypothetical protein